jgi:mediator of RNA polymerase II transcription subunit 25
MLLSNENTIDELRSETMTDNELLLAISNMMDAKLEPVNNEIQGIKGELQGIKGEIRDLKEDVQVLKEDVQVLKEDVQVLKEDVADLKIRVKKIELTQETQILPQLNTIQECYISTYNRYKTSVDDYEEMKLDISVLKNVVAQHSEKLRILA